MSKRRYLRAYLAGICCPTIFLLAVVTGYTVDRYVINDVPAPLERFIVFPMAVVPNLWGLWNVLYVALHERLRLSLGLHGALLPLILGPLAMILSGTLRVQIPTSAAHVLPFIVPIAIILYYLIWKYLVGFLNAELGIV